MESKQHKFRIVIEVDGFTFGRLLKGGIFRATVNRSLRELISRIISKHPDVTLKCENGSVFNIDNAPGIEQLKERVKVIERGTFSYVKEIVLSIKRKS